MDQNSSPGALERNRAIAAALRAESRVWMDGYYDIASRIALRGAPFTGEDVRLYCASVGYPLPHDPNVWGAAFSSFVRKGTIKRTGRQLDMLDRRSHARKTAEWVAKAAT